MILSDKTLRTTYSHAIEPFVAHQVSRDDYGRKVISYGLSSYGYDIRMGGQSLVYGCTPGMCDPKDFDVLHDRAYTYEPFELGPGEFCLTYSLETIRVPRGCLGVVMGKSTYARCGIVVNTTPLEPDWVGQITLELSNTNTHPVRLYPLEGIAQLVFLRGDQECLVSYADRKGKYQCQVGVVTPRV